MKFEETMEIVTVLFLLYQGQWTAIEEYKTLEACGAALEYMITGYASDGGATLEGFCHEFEKTTNLERIEII